MARWRICLQTEIRVVTTRRSRTTSRDLPPFYLPLLAGLPIGLCLIVMDLPTLGQQHALPIRALLLLAFLAWTVPVTALQRALWKKWAPWWVTAVGMLSVTYAISVSNNALALGLFHLQSWPLPPHLHWTLLFQGLESCWLALIAFCAVHAVVAYYFELRQEQTQRLQALALARDAELRALRYQLHPHFLFNTLNAISSLVSDNRPHDARHMIARLGDFLRATLDSPEHHEVALADEISLTESYLEIEKARLGERLKMHWHIGECVLQARVPYLLLQPLVENAIRHGIAQRSRPGTLTIEVFRDGGLLHVRLRNDVAPTGLHSADAELHRNGSVGLVNVAERLAHLYPESHRFHAGPCEDGGYEVKLSLPFTVAVNSTAKEAK